MKSGRKNLKKASQEDGFFLQEGEIIMQVFSLRGSNVIEVMDAQGVKSLALFPAKFQRSFWIKRGNFVVVDVGGREKALESGGKIACIVSRVLFHAQVRHLERSPDWPARFRRSSARPEEELKASEVPPEAEGMMDAMKRDSDDSDDDDLPPLEANLNRRPADLYSDSDSDQD